MPRRASLKTIEAKIRELEAKAEGLRNAEKPGVKQLRAILKKFNLTQADAHQALGGRTIDRSSKLKGVQVKPKYRNPANKKETWSGRGLKPHWMVAAMKGGKKQEDFAI